MIRKIGCYKKKIAVRTTITTYEYLVPFYILTRPCFPFALKLRPRATRKYSIAPRVVESHSAQRPRVLLFVGLEGKTARSEQFIMEEDGALLGKKVQIRWRWARVFHKLLNTKSIKRDRTIIDSLPPRPLGPSRGDKPSADELMRALTSMPIWKAMGYDKASWCRRCCSTCSLLLLRYTCF